MSGFSGKLARKQEEAIVALLSQRNVEEAAKAVNVAPRTLYRWMKDAEFQSAYREAKRAAFSQSIARLHQMSSAAVSTLAKIMVDANAPASVRVRAADSILDHTAKAIEIEDIEARVAALEAATGKNGARP
jgi:Helix-turn-helix domain